MSGFNIFQHPPIILTLWWYDKKYGCIWMHIGPTTRLWSPFNNYYVQKSEERGKTTWGKSSLNIGQGTKFWNNMSSTYPYLHLNELNEFLLDGRLVEEIMNSVIMRWSVEPGRRKRRDSLYLIIWWSRSIIWMLLAAIKL